MLLDELGCAAEENLFLIRAVGQGDRGLVRVPQVADMFASIARSVPAAERRLWPIRPKIILVIEVAQTRIEASAEGCMRGRRHTGVPVKQAIRNRGGGNAGCV